MITFTIGNDDMTAKPRHNPDSNLQASDQSGCNASKVADKILAGFDKSYRWYSRITADAKHRFENGLWQENQQAAKERILIYEQSLAGVVAETYQLISPHSQTSAFWLRLKQQFTALLNNHPQFELAETFYNSVIGRLFRHQKINNEMMFVLPSRCFLAGRDRQAVINRFDTQVTVRAMYEQIFRTYRFNIPFENWPRDLQNLDNAMRARLSREQLASVHTVEMLKPVFYRGKAAYLIGRVCMPETTLPFVIAMLNSEDKQLVVDAMLMDSKDLSAVFSFARSYFMADSQYPAEVVAFLQQLLPNKKHFELYISLGFHKHGKTVFYRNLLQHLERSNDDFTTAPGVPGLVMMVFHLPSYGVVFKIIKDKFGDSKKITRQQVKARYRLVKMSDRVGRMADTHEYVNFRLPRSRISAPLLEELLATCASSIELSEHEVIIKHLYIERKMTPLNLYLEQEQDPQKIKQAINELGLCIKQIAASNIFPGDMLHKNFGVSRQGRVIFYDYDEICSLQQPQFRHLPHNDDWYAMDTMSIGPNDVFPEQFEHFIVGKKHLKQLLKTLHPELMQVEYWLALQAQASNMDIPNFTPYSLEHRFS